MTPSTFNNPSMLFAREGVLTKVEEEEDALRFLSRNARRSQGRSPGDNATLLTNPAVRAAPDKFTSRSVKMCPGSNANSSNSNSNVETLLFRSVTRFREKFQDWLVTRCLINTVRH